MRMLLVRSGAAVAVGAIVLAATPVAGAEEPLVVAEPITDQVGALSGREAEVAEAQDRLFEDHHLDLRVVYVESFGESSPADWAEETAERSALDINQALLAVATADRAYHLWLDDEYPLSGGQLSEIHTVAVEPALEANDWAGTAIGAAEGLRATLRGENATEPEIVPGDPEPSADGGFPWLALVILAVVVAAILAVQVYVRLRRRAGAGADSGIPPIADRSPEDTAPTSTDAGDHREGHGSGDSPTR